MGTPMNGADRRELAGWMREHGFGRVAEAVAAAARPCVRLLTRAMDEDKIAVGSSRIGGRPDLPAGFEWPRKNGKRLLFLMQVRAADAAAQDEEGVLPRSGYLWFFYDADEQPWGFDPKDRDGWAVRYADVDAGQLMRAGDAGETGEGLAPLAVKFERTLSLAGDSRLMAAGTELTDDELDRWFELGDEDGPFATIGHRLLGHPCPVQGDHMEEECQLASAGVYCGNADGYESEKGRALLAGASRWRLLLQLASDEDAGAMWGDCGMIYFWIPEESLRERKFEDAWLVLQCG